MTTSKKTLKKRSRPSVKKTASTVKKKRVIKKKAKAVKSSPVKKSIKKKGTASGSIKENTDNRMTLDPVLVINNAKSMLDSIDKLVNTDDDVYIDASGVEMVDTAILQLLLAASIKIRSKNHKVVWTKPSDIFLSNATLLGLSEALGVE
ncbi:MAG: STAS domain-containing protein [Gammaproteobacteria bacterium]|nr:STAS domain-containing protein [Gammaproteobacteria bacterium]NNJ49663.1 STAS domain-containing protein [Gammaproteobacteria bacterium]